MVCRAHVQKLYVLSCVSFQLGSMVSKTFCFFMVLGADVQKPLFWTFTGSAVQHTLVLSCFLRERRAKAQWLQGPPEKWMNPPDLHLLPPLGRASSAPPSLSLGLFFKDSQNFLEDSQKFLERFQDILLRLRLSKPRTRWIGGCKFVRHQKHVPCLKNWKYLCWSCLVCSEKTLKLFFAGRVLCILENLFVSGRVFGCLKNLKRLVVGRVSGIWDRFCVAINTHKVWQVPEHDQQHKHIRFLRVSGHTSSNNTLGIYQTLESQQD